MTEKSIAVPLTDDLVDRIAMEIANGLCDYLECMYPNVTTAVAWQSCKRSIHGHLRNDVASAGKAAESGSVDTWIKTRRAHRKKMRKLRALGKLAEYRREARTAE